MRSSLLVLFCLAACGGGTNSRHPQSASSSEGPFAPYAGEAQQLFDDRIEPLSVGLADVNVKPQADPLLRSRTQQAEIAARVRVATVTAETTGGQVTYRLALKVLDPLARRGSPVTSVELLIGSNSPAFGIVKWLDTRMIGWTFIGFFRRFSGNVDEEMHFHFAADNRATIAAVREAAMLGEVAVR